MGGMKKRKSRDSEVAKRKREAEEMRANKMVVMAAADVVAAEAEDRMWMMTAVDEQMSWGTQWFPFWDVESYLSGLYESDAVWEGYDDIWGLRTSDQIPTPAAAAVAASLSSN